MTTEAETVAATEIPTGAWTLDPIHSVAGFAIRHMMVGTFRGEFSEIDASLSDGVLVGRVPVASIQLKNEQLKAHVLTPDFFDAERHPEIVFESSALDIAYGTLSAAGTLTIKGTALPVTATGRLAGPVLSLGDIEKIGIDLEATIDRDAVGLEWNAPLPQGGVALGNTVTITISLELARAEED
jgi:polyisoprenoid-binding protein YceI